MIDVLFVCYGNICRSPTAEALLDAKLRALLGPDHGVVVASAGVGAIDGLKATREACRSMADRGIDMTAHRAQMLTPALARRAKAIYCMDADQAAQARALAPDARVEVLGGGVEDPMGCGQWVYESVAHKLDGLVDPIAKELAATHGPAHGSAAGGTPA